MCYPSHGFIGNSKNHDKNLVLEIILIIYFFDRDVIFFAKERYLYIFVIWIILPFAT